MKTSWTRLAIGLAAMALAGSIRGGDRSEGTWDSLTAEAMARCADRERCTVHLARVYPQAWDRLLIFSEVVPQGGVEKAIGRPLARFDEYCTTLVFLRADGGVARVFQADCSDGDRHSPGRRSGIAFGSSSRIDLTRLDDALDVYRHPGPGGDFFE